MDNQKHLPGTGRNVYDPRLRARSGSRTCGRSRDRGGTITTCSGESSITKQTGRSRSTMQSGKTRTAWSGWSPRPHGHRRNRGRRLTRSTRSPPDCPDHRRRRHHRWGATYRHRTQNRRIVRPRHRRRRHKEPHTATIAPTTKAAGQAVIHEDICNHSGSLRSAPCWRQYRRDTTDAKAIPRQNTPKACLDATPHSKRYQAVSLGCYDDRPWPVRSHHPSTCAQSVLYRTLATVQV